MSYFESKTRTVFSPKNEMLQPFYNMLEQYAPVVGGSQLFEDMVETYEYLEFVLKEDEKR